MTDQPPVAPLPQPQISYPSWIERFVPWDRPYRSDDEKMELAIDLSRKNVEEATGGPFGAAIFDPEGRLVSVGVNSVVRLGNSTLHGEMVAIMMAQARLGRFTLRDDEEKAYELFTSCEPCAMCLGAILWSGVRRVVCGAHRDDALHVGFDEGPVFPESYAYLEGRGIEIVRCLRRDEARAVLEQYKASGGVIYNG